MSVPYRIIKRVDPAYPKGARRYHAIVDTHVVSFDTLVTEIAEGCTLTSADVKAVLDRANHVLDRHLTVGGNVQFGELGNSRISLSSAGADTVADFKTSLIRSQRILFTPGSALRSALKSVSYSRSSSESGTAQAADEVA